MALERHAPNSLSRIEEVSPGPVGHEGIVRDPIDQLLEAPRQAYLEAAGCLLSSEAEWGRGPWIRERGHVVKMPEVAVAVE
jgi:hypothetical protein